MEESKRTEGKIICVNALMSPNDKVLVATSKDKPLLIETVNIAVMCNLPNGEVDANIEFMKKAWNNHDELVKALRRAHAFIDYDLNNNSGINSRSYNRILSEIEPILKEVEGN